jgi:1,4-dihydroxy-2-naphthoate octaprenyltransferase
MATVTDWIEGARLRTLPAAAAPVIVGSAAAHHLGGFDAVRASLALVVALALQVGVNYANDYSDGIRGTDDNRKGPARLTGGGLAKPKTVLAAALGCFALAGVAGLALVALSGTWWLIVAGAAAIVAAWFYTGGKHPYAYMGVGLSELMVFVFFGLLACVGTAWTQVQVAPWWLWMCASALGLLSVALLMANNIRDIPTDRESGKMTAAVRLGDRASRWVFAACAWVPVGMIVALGVALGMHPLATCALGVGAAAPAVGVSLPVLTGASGRALIVVLRNTGFFTLAWAILAGLALVLS